MKYIAQLYMPYIDMVNNNTYDYSRHVSSIHLSIFDDTILEGIVEKFDYDYKFKVFTDSKNKDYKLFTNSTEAENFAKSIYKSEEDVFWIVLMEVITTKRLSIDEFIQLNTIIGKKLRLHKSRYIDLFNEAD